MRIVVLSDTHLPADISELGHLGPEPAALLQTADLILHAGDIVLPSVLDWCERFASVKSAIGAHDQFEDPRTAPVVVVEHEGWRIGVVHDVEAIPPTIKTVDDLKREVYRDPMLDILIAGDSHFERLEYKSGTLLLDPASPCFPHHRSTRLGAMGVLDLDTYRVRAEIVVLGETPGAPNPCTPAHLEINREGLLKASTGGVPQDVSSGTFRWRPRAAPPLPV